MQEMMEYSNATNPSLHLWLSEREVKQKYNKTTIIGKE